MFRSVPVAFLLAACAGTPPVPTPPRIERPSVAVVRRLEAGTLLGTKLSDGVPDDALHRAAAIWWREALRQSIAFDVVDGRAPRPAAVIVLAIDAGGRRLSALYRGADGDEVALAGGVYSEGGLPAGIDRLAWACRLALGEDAPPPVPVAAALSANPRAVDAARDGFLLLRDGAVRGALRALRTARRADGASPYVLDGLAAIALLRGEVSPAERLAREALGYTNRLTPITRHRLARTLLLARASRHPEFAPDHDRELLALGRAMVRERPHDPEGQKSIAIAENLLGEFAAARPRLERLAARLPDDATVQYHLGWASLGSNDPEAALAAFEEAARRLPETWVTIPRAIALANAGRHDELDRLLSERAARLRPQDTGLAHEIRRMQAAHALLTGRRELAAKFLREDIHGLLTHPTLLDTRAGRLADEGEVLVRLGHTADLEPALAAIQAQHPGTAVADACAYLSGLVQVSRLRERATILEERLSHSGESVFSRRLEAFAHEVRGELADMHAALAHAARMDDSAMTKALLARSLCSMGREEEGRALREALHRELTTIRLRRRPSYPLLGPELAFAYLIE